MKIQSGTCYSGGLELMSEAKYIFKPFQRLIFATEQGCTLFVKDAETIENQIEFQEMKGYIEFVKYDFH